MKRDTSIDSAAGIMILYMVFVHVFQHFHLEQTALFVTMQHLLYFFMPWFFFKAGMFFKAGDNKEVFMKSTKRLIKPFIIYSLIGHICWCLLCYLDGNLTLSELFPVKAFLFVGSISGNLPLWFLLSLFACRIIFNYALNKNIPVQLVSVVSLAFASLLHFTGFEYPLYVANISTGLFFMSLGYFITKRFTITPPPAGYMLSYVGITAILPVLRGNEK